MKRALIALALVATSALANVTLTNQEDRGWQAIRGTTNVGAPHATEAACLTAIQADTEARKASANYRCVNTKAARAEWVAAPVVVPPVVVPPVVVPPADPHNGGHHAGNMPHYNVASIPAPAVGSSTYDIWQSGEIPRASDNGAFRTVCGPSHFNRDDALVYPGQPGRAHLHMYWGNTGSNANSTPESLRGTGNSTCRGGIANRSSYWMPAMIDTATGNVVPMDAADVYYKQGYNGLRADQIIPIPPGLSMIEGDMTRKTKLEDGSVTFSCEGKRDKGIPVCTTGELVVNINFPQCWNGKDLYKPDQSHMARTVNGQCPATHPQALPEISYTIHFKITGSTAGWRLSSDNYVGGQGGYSMHADWINGWDPVLPLIWTTEIVNKSRDGGSHMLGDGRAMY